MTEQRNTFRDQPDERGHFGDFGADVGARERLGHGGSGERGRSDQRENKVTHSYSPSCPSQGNFRLLFRQGPGPLKSRAIRVNQ